MSRGRVENRDFSLYKPLSSESLKCEQPNCTVVNARNSRTIICFSDEICSLTQEKSNANRCLEHKQIQLKRYMLAVNLVAQAKAVDPDNFKVWLVSAQLAAVMSGGPSIGPGLLVNTEVLSHLIHAGFTGSNYRVASQLTLHLIPIIIEYAQYNFLCDPSTTTSSSISMSQQDSSALIQMFDKRAHLRLSINVAIECLNRAIGK
ncbi:unnamed protein product [Heterobilharzia americana]|nr:unnamed protein product [Heterobilharzia americana]